MTLPNISKISQRIRPAEPITRQRSPVAFPLANLYLHSAQSPLGDLAGRLPGWLEVAVEVSLLLSLDVQAVEECAPLLPSRAVQGGGRAEVLAPDDPGPPRGLVRPPLVEESLACASVAVEGAEEQVSGSCGVLRPHCCHLGAASEAPELRGGIGHHAPVAARPGRAGSGAIVQGVLWEKRACIE